MKIAPKIPFFYLTLNISLEDRKKVFDLLVENKIPMDDEVLESGGEIDEGFPYLVWCHESIIEVANFGLGPHLSPKEFLNQFGIE